MLTESYIRNINVYKWVYISPNLNKWVDIKYKIYIYGYYVEHLIFGHNNPNQLQSNFIHSSSPPQSTYRSKNDRWEGEEDEEEEVVCRLDNIKTQKSFDYFMLCVPQNKKITHPRAT